MRCVCVRGNERVSRECFLLFFSTSFNIFFFGKRDKKGVCGSGDGKELEKCREFFFRS